MKIIPKFQNGTFDPDWYYHLNTWKQLELPGFQSPKGGKYTNPAFKDRLTGKSLDRAYERNTAYITSKKDIRQGDISNYFKDSNYEDLGSALKAYNSDIDILDNTFSSGEFDYDKNKFDATLHNNTFKKVYQSSAQNGSELYKTGWDENQISQGGSGTWQRRATKYSTTFQDDLNNNIDSAKDRVYETPYGFAYVDETGRLNPLNEDMQETLGIIPREKYEGDPCVQSYIKQGMDEAQARALCSGKAIDNGNPVVKNTPEEKKVEKPQEEGSSVSSKNVNNPAKKNKLSGIWNSLSEFAPMLIGAGRVAIDNAVNRKATDEYLSHIKAPLQSPWEAYRLIHGDYIAKQSGEQQAARLRNTASRPFTADADKQMAYQLEAVDKGNNYLLAGQQRDAAEFYRTSEIAANQSIQNIQNRTNVANTNRQLLSQYDEMRARIKKDQKIQNMQNWDRWAATWEDRALAKYDYNQQKKRNTQEQLDSLSDYIGVDDNIYKQKYYEWVNETDPARKSVLEQELIDLKKKNQLQVYRNMGDRAGVNWNKAWLDTFKKNKVSSAYQNGGILRKLQQGGGFPLVQWTPVMGAPYQQYLALLMSGEGGSSQKASRSKSSSSDSDKEETTLLKNIVETLKGADILSSDMEILSTQLNRFFDIQRYAPEGLSVDHLYRGYVDALVNLNRAKQSSNNFKQAYDNTLKNGGLHEAAIDAQGMVYVGVVGTGEMKSVTPTQYLEHQDELRLLTNEDLLYLRQTQPKYAFNDKVLSGVVSNGVGMDQVQKFVKQFVGTLGYNKESRDQMVYTYGHQAVQGIQVLQDLLKNGFTDEQTAAIMARGVDGLWELNTMTQGQIQQAKLAQSAVLQSLPKNMQSLLILRAGGPKEAAELVGKMILSGTTAQSAFNIEDITALDENGNLKSSTKTGKGSTGSGGEEQEDRTLLNIQEGIGGTPDRLVLNPGTKSQLEVDGSNYQVKGSYTAADLATTLSETNIMGISDPRKIYFGDQKLPAEKLSDIAYLGRGFSRVILPIKADGSPNFEVLTKYEEACENVRLAGLDPMDKNSEEGQRRLAEELQKVGLLGLINNGMPDMSKVGLFLVTEGLGSSKAGLTQSTYVRLKEDADYDLMSQLLSKKGLDGKVQEYELDKPDWGGFFPGDWFGMYDSIYEGTIYIPISNNKLQGSTASGNKIKPQNAYGKESEYQRWDNLRRYRPGVSPDDMLSQ